MDFTILRFEKLSSTNTEAIQQAKLGAEEGLCVVADEQTAGRGRHGRSWSSPKGGGLYLSIVLRPKIYNGHLSLITLLTGIAVHDALLELGLKPDIKWVNDILVGEKKISGILAETAETPAGLAVVVGIGVNLTSKGFPDEVAKSSTSIKAETGLSAEAGQVLQILTPQLSKFYEILHETDGSSKIVDHWRLRSTYFSGKRVRVTLSDGSFEGETCGLEANGALRVTTAEGNVRIVQAGDVERVRVPDTATFISPFCSPI
ncbi:MAG: biotin--[acetyl-CoA-carboxylase] ligase [Acidobacteriota bacterium]